MGVYEIYRLMSIPKVDLPDLECRCLYEEMPTDQLLASKRTTSESETRKQDSKEMGKEKKFIVVNRLQQACRNMSHA